MEERLKKMIKQKCNLCKRPIEGIIYLLFLPSNYFSIPPTGRNIITCKECNLGLLSQIYNFSMKQIEVIILTCLQLELSKELPKKLS